MEHAKPTVTVTQIELYASQTAPASTVCEDNTWRSGASLAAVALAVIGDAKYVAYSMGLATRSGFAGVG